MNAANSGLLDVMVGSRLWTKMELKLIPFVFVSWLVAMPLVFSAPDDMASVGIQSDQVPLDEPSAVELEASVVRQKFPDPSGQLVPTPDLGQDAASQGTASKLEAIIRKTQTSAWQRYNNLGKAAYNQGYYEDAEKNFLSAIRELKKTNEKDDRLLKSRNNLGLTYIMLGKYLDAKEVFVLAINLSKELYGSKSQQATRSLNGLATVYKYMGQQKKAEQTYKDALKMQEELLGANHPAVAECLVDLGELYRQQKLYDEATPVYELALETLNKASGVPELTKAYFLDKTGNLFHDQGKMEEARRCFEMAIMMKDKYSTLYSPIDPRKRGLVYYRCLNGIPNAFRVFNRGTEIECLHVKDAVVVATLTAEIFGSDWYLLKAEVTVQNQGKTAISALSEPPSLALESPKQKVYGPLDSDAIAGELGSRGRRLYNRLLHSADFAYVVDQVGAGSGVSVYNNPFTGPTVVRNYQNWVTMRPDWAARLQARNAALRALASAERQGMTVLKAKPAQTTIGPGETATFLIFYPYVKFDACTLRVLLGNSVLEFPFTSHSG